MTSNKGNKQLGAIFGAAVGDALGLTYEFKKPGWIPAPPFNIVGGGPFNFPLGDGSDDTDLMYVVLNNYDKNGVYSLEGAMQDMVAWLATNPPDIGNQTRTSLIHWRDYRDEPAVDQDAQGNGGLMRAAPHALVTPKIEEAASYAYFDTRATHNSDLAGDASAFYAAYLWWLVHRDTSTTMARFRARGLSQNAYMKFIPYANYIEAHNMGGHCLHSLRLALLAVETAKSFEDGINRVISTGGDTDTNACIAGALLGARFGYSGIPGRWKFDLSQTNAERLVLACDKLEVKLPVLVY